MDLRASSLYAIFMTRLFLACLLTRCGTRLRFRGPLNVAAAAGHARDELLVAVESFITVFSLARRYTVDTGKSYTIRLAICRLGITHLLALLILFLQAFLPLLLGDGTLAG